LDRDLTVEIKRGIYLFELGLGLLSMASNLRRGWLWFDGWRGSGCFLSTAMAERGIGGHGGLENMVEYVDFFPTRARETAGGGGAWVCFG
jgi:hypothetical protein